MGRDRHGQTVSTQTIEIDRVIHFGERGIGNSLIHLASPSIIEADLREGVLADVLAAVARLAGAELRLSKSTEAPVQPEGDQILPVRYEGAMLGYVAAEPHLAEPSDSLRLGARAAQKLLQHAVDREMVVADCASQLVGNYEELDMLYSLLASISTKLHEAEVAEAVVERTAETLNCARVSLLELDPEGQYLRVLASRGLPPEVQDISIPVTESVAGAVITEPNPLISGDINHYPGLSELSRGEYESDSVVVIRVPMQARGRPVGVLTATERRAGAEFDTRDHKLLEGLSTIGATALMHCRLHAAAKQQMMNTIGALACAVDAKDRYTHDHTARVARLSMLTARKMGVKETETLRKIELAGLLHDVGKIGIPDAILCKPGRLTPEEYDTIKTHVSIGAKIVGEVDGLEDVAMAIQHHHERHDGLGYPSGLSGDAIPLASRLIAVVDAFDSLTSDRSYRKATTTTAALQEIDRCRGLQFDPAVTDAFRTVVQEDERTDRALEPAAT